MRKRQGVLCTEMGTRQRQTRTRAHRCRLRSAGIRASRSQDPSAASASPPSVCPLSVDSLCVDSCVCHITCGLLYLSHRDWPHNSGNFCIVIPFKPALYFLCCRIRASRSQDPSAASASPPSVRPLSVDPLCVDQIRNRM